MKILLLGDTHADFDAIHKAIQVAEELQVSTILQLGDFGIGFGHHTSWRKVGEKLRRKGIKLYAVRGNHDDPGAIERLPKELDGTHWFQPNLYFLPSGHRWSWGGRTFVALPGAPSVNRTMLQGLMRDRLVKSPIWWAGECYTEEETEAVAAGGYADVLVGHDAPFGIRPLEAFIEGNPHGFREDDLEYALDARKLYHKAFEAVAPKLSLSGHYHLTAQDRLPVKNEQGFCDAHVLHKNGEPGNLAILETQDLSVTYL